MTLEMAPFPFCRKDKAISDRRNTKMPLRSRSKRKTRLQFFPLWWDRVRNLRVPVERHGRHSTPIFFASLSFVPWRLHARIRKVDFVDLGSHSFRLFRTMILNLISRRSGFYYDGAVFSSWLRQLHRPQLDVWTSDLDGSKTGLYHQHYSSPITGNFLFY